MFQPLGNRVLVKPAEETKQTSSGLYITTQLSVEKGEIVAVGEGAVTMSGDVIEMEVKVGDQVLYPAKKGGVELEFDGETFFLFHETDLFGILR